MKTLIEADKETEEEDTSFQSSTNSVNPLKSDSLLSTPRSKRIEQKIVERRGKRIKFLINGNRFFRGIRYCLCTERIRSFDVLLQDLNRLIKDVNLPKGVQYIYTYGDKVRSHKLSSLDEFKENRIYLVSSHDHYIDLDYTAISQGFDCGNSGFGYNHLSKSISYTAADQRLKGINGPFASSSASNNSSRNQLKGVTDSLPFIRPKLVNIIISGPKPREVIKLLLNKRSVHSYDQLLTDIQAKSKTLLTPIRRVYAINGRKISKLKDFFGDQDIFVATTAERCTKQEFDIQPEECSNIHFGRFLMGKDTSNVVAGMQPRAQSVSISHAINSSSSFSSTTSDSSSSSSYSSSDLAEAHHHHASHRNNGQKVQRKHGSCRDIRLVKTNDIDDDVFLLEDQPNIYIKNSSRTQYKSPYKVNSSSIPSRIHQIPRIINNNNNPIKIKPTNISSIPTPDRRKQHQQQQISQINTSNINSNTLRLIASNISKNDKSDPSFSFKDSSSSSSRKSSTTSSFKNNDLQSDSNNRQQSSPAHDRQGPSNKTTTITATWNGSRNTKRQIRRTDGNGLDMKVVKAKSTTNMQQEMRKSENRANQADGVINSNKQANQIAIRPSSLKYRSKIPTLQNDTSPKVVIRPIINDVPKTKPQPTQPTSPLCESIIPREIARKYEVGSIIGDGNFAVVHECVNKLTRKRFAMKIINKKRCRGKEASKTEVTILRKINHPFIIQLLEDYDYTNEMYLVMELVTGGDLFYAITTKDR